MSRLLGVGAYGRVKNTLAGLCTKNAEGAYARGGPYLRDTMVQSSISTLGFLIYNT